MRRPPSLKLRLMLLISLMIGLLCLAAGAYLLQRAQKDVRGEVYSATELVEHYLDARMSLARARWRDNPDQMPRLELARLSDVRHVDVYFYNAVGTLLERSGAPANHRTVAPDWFTWLVQRSVEPIPDVRHFVVFDGFAVGMLRIRANPAFEIDEIWNVSRGLAGLLIAFGLVVNLLVWWAVGRALLPLSRVRQALNELSAGQFAARLPALDLPELRGVAVDFNRMAETLENSTAENRRLTHRLLQVQEEERARIARELHDEIGQCVTAIHADAVSIQRAARGQPNIEPGAAAIIEVTARIKLLVRDMLRRLHPAVVEERGLAGALAELAGQFRQRNPQTQCEVHLADGAGELRGEKAEAVFRIVQEALTNVTRHAGAHRVRIDIVLGEPREGAAPQIELRVEDDGDGFETARAPPGHGIRGMRERLSALRGSLEIRSRPRGGTRIDARLPL